MFWPSIFTALVFWMGGLSTSEKWAYGSAFIVLIGVTGETVADLTDWIKDKHLSKVVEKISALVLILGLAGDLVSISLARGEFAAITKEAGDAQSSATRAALAASTAKTSADHANAVAGEALQTSKDATEAANKVKQQVEAVGRAAASIDAQVYMTQALLSARMLQNRDKLSGELKAKFRGREIILRSYIGDQEGWGLCTQLWHVAKDAEMNPKDECGTAPLTVPLASPGTISGPDVDETVRLSGLITSIGRLGFWSGVRAPALTIFVGAKTGFVITQARGVPVNKQQNKPSAKP